MAAASFGHLLPAEPNPEAASLKLVRLIGAVPRNTGPSAAEPAGRRPVPPNPAVETGANVSVPGRGGRCELTAAWLLLLLAPFNPSCIRDGGLCMGRVNEQKINVGLRACGYLE